MNSVPRVFYTTFVASLHIQTFERTPGAQYGLRDEDLLPLQIKYKSFSKRLKWPPSLIPIWQILTFSGRANPSVLTTNVQVLKWASPLTISPGLMVKWISISPLADGNKSRFQRRHAVLRGRARSSAAAPLGNNQASLPVVVEFSISSAYRDVLANESSRFPLLSLCQALMWILLQTVTLIPAW